MEQFILALDEGTTSCRAVVFDKRCKMVAVEQKEFTATAKRSRVSSRDISAKALRLPDGKHDSIGDCR